MRMILQSLPKEFYLTEVKSILTVSQGSTSWSESPSAFFATSFFVHLLSNATFGVILLRTSRTYRSLFEMFLSSLSQCYLVITEITCVYTYI